MPHLLFHGAPGTGKTSTILALCNDLFGPKLSKRRVLFLNASDDRGIDVIRHRVKDFARIVSTAKVPGYPCPEYKFVILDEADNITPDAQSALRRTMEACSTNTRMCLICNYVSRIIDPIKSRCAKFRFQPVSDEACLARLEYVRDAENLMLPEGVLPRIVETAEGDLRKAITTLQTACTAFGSPTVQNIDYVVGRIEDGVVAMIYQQIPVAPLDQARDVTRQAYPVRQLMGQMVKLLHEDVDLSDQAKAQILTRMAAVDRKVQDGALQELQAMDLFSFMAFIRNNAVNQQ